MTTKRGIPCDMVLVDFAAAWCTPSRSNCLETPGVQIVAQVVTSIMLNPTATVLLYGVLPMPAAALGVLFLATDILGLAGVSREWSGVRCLCSPIAVRFK